jgi:hypothetical protein
LLGLLSFIRGRALQRWQGLLVDVELEARGYDDKGRALRYLLTSPLVVAAAMVES